MDQILIPFESELAINTDSLELIINKQLVNYQIVDSTIVIDTDIAEFGLNLLNIRLVSPPENFLLKIKDFILNKVSSRQTLYLTFCQQQGKNVCTTWLTDRDNFITIPFGNPISWWLGECAKKIPNSLYGTNLYDKFEIFYPESIKIDNKFPRLMQDFMKHNLGFYIVLKEEYSKPIHNKKIPYLRINLEYDEHALFKEFSENINLLESDDYAPKQNEYNKGEVEKLELWQISMAVRTNKTKNNIGWKDTIIYRQDQFPVFYKLLEQITNINGIRIIHAFIGQVKSYSYVAPHMDDFYKYINEYKNTEGCSQFFIPIGWKQGNYFKFSDIGEVPYDQGALLVNNSEFMHGSINASDSVRFTIGILCEFTDDGINQL